MMRSLSMALALSVVLLAGCTGEPRSRASSAQQVACRQRADQVFYRQNPGELARSDLYVSAQRDTPFGGSGVNDPTAALSARYARDQLLDNCLRNATIQPNAAP
jgi:hypothetical protein